MKFITLENKDGFLDFGVPYCDIVEELEKNNVIHIKKFIPNKDLISELNWLCQEDIWHELNKGYSNDRIWHELDKKDLRNEILQSIKPNQPANHKFSYIHFDFIDQEKRIDNDVFRIMPSFLSPIYKKMIDFHCFLTGYERDPLEYRKQLVSYTEDAFFGLHQHDYEPQKYGFITLLSKKGRDYSKGGTRFYYKDKMLDTGEIEDIGDMFIFKYDLIHEVTEISTEDCEGYRYRDKGEMWEIKLGRKTALIPWIEKFSKVAIDVD
jgi:hypothetical protein